ncbi:MAG: flavin reductase family protein [Dehalococcoidales bacterium]|nr:flavin reductase family protein [Dehalococcoidales bacterium]
MTKVQLGPQPSLYPMPVVMVGTNIDGKPNFMTVAWCGIVNGSPPMISIAIGSHNHTQKGIRQNMAFSINIPSTDIVKEADFCGITSGADVDKVSICKFKLFNGKTANAPMIEQCPINMECKVAQIFDWGGVYFIIGRIEETHVSDNCLTRGKLDAGKLKLLAYTRAPSPKYYALNEVIGDAYSIGKSLKTRK